MSAKHAQRLRGAAREAALAFLRQNGDLAAKAAFRPFYAKVDGWLKKAVPDPEMVFAGEFHATIIRARVHRRIQEQEEWRASK